MQWKIPGVSKPQCRGDATDQNAACPHTVIISDSLAASVQINVLQDYGSSCFAVSHVLVMMWRTISFLVILFWLVMSVLLVRLTYFPDGTAFGKVPPDMVLRMFMDQGTSLNTLHIYRDQAKIGYASVASRRGEPEHGRPDKVEANGDRSLMASGVLDKGAISDITPDQVAWRFDLNLGDLTQIKGSTGQIRLMDAGLVLDYQWAAGEKMPRFTLKHHGQLLGDQSSSLMMGQMLGMPNIDGFLPEGGKAAPPDDASSLMKVNARQGAMNLSGQKRKGYVLEVSFMERWKVKAFFTEVGELAVVDLPEGYRLVEPVIHGLQPDFEGADYEEPDVSP